MTEIDDIGKLVTGIMAHYDPMYRAWSAGYSGTTDNGVVAPIWLVAPGAIVNGSAIGYMPAASMTEALKAWDWAWVTCADAEQPSCPVNEPTPTT